MGLHDEELKLLEDILLENPQKGDVIEGTSGARKMRIQMNGHGKRGGGRVIYVDIFEKEKLYFLFAYPKNVQVNLTEQQKKIVRQMVEAIKGE
ncbi:MAG: type II toxin-antitoxin system RelE/ParE family toxin [Butyricicoccus sp.]